MEYAIFLFSATSKRKNLYSEIAKTSKNISLCFYIVNSLSYDKKK